MKRKTVLITGGVTGIGKSTAYYLAKIGYNVIINYRKSSEQAIKLCQKLVEQYKIKSFAIQGDVGNLSDCQKIYEEVCTEFSGVDILIHNAGPYIDERKRLSEYEFEEWDYLINGNLNGVFYLTKLFLPFMEKRRWGRIITFGFDRAETAPGWANRSAFAAAKSGLASLTKTLSIEEAPFGITVNMISPGDIANDWKEKHIQEAKQTKDDTTPIGRPGTGEDIARVIGFLCEDQSDFITGSIIPVSGGKDVLGKMRSVYRSM